MDGLNGVENEDDVVDDDDAKMVILSLGLLVDDKGKGNVELRGLRNWTVRKGVSFDENCKAVAADASMAAILWFSSSPFRTEMDELNSLQPASGSGCYYWAFVQ